MASYRCAFMIKSLILVNKNFLAACSPQLPSSAPSSLGRVSKDTQIRAEVPLWSAYWHASTSDDLLGMRFFAQITHLGS